MSLPVNQIIQGDCLIELPKITSGTIDMILTDLPYQITQNQWDSMIPLDKLWTEFKRVIKDNGAIVLTAAQPFTSILVNSNLEMFKYGWIWKKGNKPTNFLNAKKQPLRITEDIVVFYKEQCTYNPQMVKGEQCHSRGKAAGVKGRDSLNYGEHLGTDTFGDMKYPQNLLDFPRDLEQLHPTQKPVALLEYLIKTYTNEGETVLDCCAGSGSTAVACVKTGRKYITIEKEQEYVQMIKERVGSMLSAFPTTT